jgi:cell division protein FtsN
MSKKSTADTQPDQKEIIIPNHKSLEGKDDKTLKLSNYDERTQGDQANKDETNSDEANQQFTEKEETPKEKNPPPIAIPVNQKPVQKPVKEDPKPLKKVSNAANMHLVIAGNFLQRTNAESRLSELNQKGYENAEVVNFDLSEYYTVIAGRFDDVIEARRIAKKVNDYLNIEAYVRVGKN